MWYNSLKLALFWCHFFIMSLTFFSVEHHFLKSLSEWTHVWLFLCILISWIIGSLNIFWFFQEITDSTVALLKSSASSEKRTAGEVVRTAHTKEILGCQDSKILSFYQELDSPKWRYRGKNLTVEERNMADGEKNLAAPPKRKQEVPTYCLGKKRLLVKKHISHERRYNWTSRQAEPSENVFCDIRSLGYEEKRDLIANIKEAVAFVTTMIFLDGSSQLNSEQVSELWISCDGFAEFFELCI